MNPNEVGVLALCLSGLQLAGSAVILIITARIDARTARLGSELKDYVAERYQTIRECDRVHTLLDARMDG